TLLAPSPARCDEPALCRPQQTRLDDDGYLRAVSLDLRGIVPTPEEHERARAEGTSALIDEWLEAPEFAERVVRRHRELLWPNISNVNRIYHFRRNLARSGTLWLQTNGQTRLTYRGVNTAGCLDEPATFDADGNIVTTEVGGARVEGYVLV